MTFHTSFTQGKRVIVFFKKGDPIIGKFVRTDHKKKVMIIRTEDDHPDKPTKIRLKRIRAVSYYRHPMTG